MGALMNVHGMGQTVTQAIKGDQDWTEVEVTFNSGNRDSIQVNCLFGGWGVSTGTAWFDDLSLQELIMEIDDQETGSLVGDATRGKRLFQEHPVASCVRCHQAQGQGGVVGPPLDDIAKRKDAAYIRESLIDPQAAIAEGYPAQVSPMPPFGVLLPPQDVEDLIAYLMTLQTDPPAGSRVVPQTIQFE